MAVTEELLGQAPHHMCLQAVYLMSSRDQISQAFPSLQTIKDQRWEQPGKEAKLVAQTTLAGSCRVTCLK